MKKIIFLIIAALIAFAIISCTATEPSTQGGSSYTDSASDNSISEESSETEPPSKEESSSEAPSSSDTNISSSQISDADSKDETSSIFSSSKNSSTSSSSSEVSSTVSSSNSQTITDNDTQGNLVWIPTNGGKKYHTCSGCSNMKNPTQVSLSTAKNRGFTACKRCH